MQLVDLGDDEQCATLYRLLRRLPHVALHYLATHVFPTTCRHQGLKLSACGQALGGELLFKKRFGFSGTPSDLLPVELGHLVNLKELLVYKNKISAVPEELGKLVQLETLNLFNNMARPHPSRGRCRL